MQANKKLVARWKKLKERNDVNDLAEIIKKHPSTVSRIMSGKQATSPEILLIIKEFYKKRRVQVASLTDDNN